MDACLFSFAVRFSMYVSVCTFLHVHFSLLMWCSLLTGGVRLLRVAEGLMRGLGRFGTQVRRLSNPSSIKPVVCPTGRLSNPSFVKPLIDWLAIHSIW